jgi:chromosome segregation ATPase
MNEEPPKDLATRAFQKRVLDEFAATRREVAEIRGEVAEIRREVAEIRVEQSSMRNDIAEIRSAIVEIRTQQAAMAKNIAALDQRLTSVAEGLSSLEDKVDSRLTETRPIWESVQQQLRKLDKKFDLVIKDLFELRSDVANHDKRIGDLEQRILAS